MTETTAFGALQAYITSLVDTNMHWNQSTNYKITHQLQSHIRHSRVVCAFVPQTCQKGLIMVTNMEAE